MKKSFTDKCLDAKNFLSEVEKANSWDELVKIYINLVLPTDEVIVIEKMRSFLENELPKIHDFETVNLIHSDTPEEIEHLVIKRMIEVIKEEAPSIAKFHTLKDIEDAGFTTQLPILQEINQQKIECLKTIEATIRGWDKILEIWKNVNENDEPIIIYRMIEILPVIVKEISDIKLLSKMFGMDVPDGLGVIVKNRIKEILEAEYGGIENLDAVLCHYIESWTGLQTTFENHIINILWTITEIEKLKELSENKKYSSIIEFIYIRSAALI